MPASCAASAVLGIGVDLVDVPRFLEFLRRNEPALGEVFTAEELDLSNSSAHRDISLAVRWAVKEAVLKALGTGWAAGVAWTEVEVFGRLHAPEVRLRGLANKVAQRASARAVRVSTARTGRCVIAVAALLR